MSAIVRPFSLGVSVGLAAAVLASTTPSQAFPSTIYHPAARCAPTNFDESETGGNYQIGVSFEYIGTAPNAFQRVTCGITPESAAGSSATDDDVWVYYEDNDATASGAMGSAVYCAVSASWYADPSLGGWYSGVRFGDGSSTGTTFAYAYSWTGAGSLRFENVNLPAWHQHTVGCWIPPKTGINGSAIRSIYRSET